MYFPRAFGLGFRVSICGKTSELREKVLVSKNIIPTDLTYGEGLRVTGYVKDDCAFVANLDPAKVSG